jgi:predicted nucleotidyltransferase
VKLVLDRLSEHGVVARDRAGRAWLYSLNRRHLMFDQIRGLMEIRSTLFARIGRLIEQWPVTPDHASVFGSATRGDGSVASDIDIFILRTDGIDGERPDWRLQLHELADEVYAMTGNHAALIEASWADLRRMVRRREPILTSLRNESVTLAGTDFRNLGLRAMQRS